ncbi:kinase [Bacillus manliponensis]|uniref:Kinase n=1 Tax=Bacillus manliponensis TaxID=574376 RepID=A0A073K935_9BACI|nr:AarF/UbiB family protein [Bacillus manliponensis]KEK18793.1 kinase [Bacillus manliponensis]
MKKFFTKQKISRSDLREYKLIGDGKDGEIYQLTDEVCVKFFFLEETQERELEALLAGQSSSVIPHVYEYGHNYIVMEFIQGISLARHLKREGDIDEELTVKIVMMLEELRRIGFKRLDTEVRHILINEEGQLKVIDHKRAFTSYNEAPTKLLTGFKKFGLAHVFLKHVRKTKPDIYRRWAGKRAR